MFFPTTAFASCAAPLIGPAGPCFDSFMINNEKISEESIMNRIYEYINANYDSWQMSERNWARVDVELELPAIVCTEFVAENVTQYRMLQWTDQYRISSLEDYRDDSLCDKWLPPKSLMTFEHYDLDHEIIPWDALEQRNDAAVFTKDMIPRSIIKAGEEFFVIQKVDFSNDNFAANSTFDAVVGYAFEKGDKMLRPPMGKNATDEDHREFSEKNRKQNNEFYQNAKFAKSFVLEVTVEEPFYVKSSFVLPDSGLYTHQFYKKLKNSPAVSESMMGGTTVVEKLSKTLSDTGGCKNKNHRMLIKRDYSALVCVTGETARHLIDRGWGL